MMIHTLKYIMNIRNIIYIGLILPIISFSACTHKEGIVSPLDGREINASFSVADVQTRVNTLDEGDRWEDGDAINVAVVADGKSVGCVLEASVTDDVTTWSHHKNFLWRGSGEHIIYVTYPSQYAYETFSLPTSQRNSLADLKSADLINGIWKGVPQYVINIPLAHRMSMVTVEYELGTADFIVGKEDICDLEVLSKFSGASFDTATGGLTPLGDAVYARAYKHEGANKFSAIVVPWTYAAGDTFLHFLIEAHADYNVNFKVPTTFEEGKVYEYSLKVGKNWVELTPGDIGSLSGWTVEEELR